MLGLAADYDSTGEHDEAGSLSFDPAPGDAAMYVNCCEDVGPLSVLIPAEAVRHVSCLGDPHSDARQRSVDRIAASCGPGSAWPDLDAYVAEVRWLEPLLDTHAEVHA